MMVLSALLALSLGTRPLSAAELSRPGAEQPAIPIPSLPAPAIAAPETGLEPLAASALNAPDPASLSQRRDVVRALQAVYLTLRRQAQDGQGDPAQRLAAARTLHGFARRYADAVASAPQLDEGSRETARRASERYLEQERLLGALLWARQQKRLIATARETAKALGTLPEEAAVQSEERPWSPPEADAHPPRTAGVGVKVWTRDLQALARDARDEKTRFELALGRRRAAERKGLSATSREREAARWLAAALRLTDFLDAHEREVDYILDHTLRMGFSDAAQRGKPLFLPTQPGLSLTRSESGYLLSAVLETKIAEPAVVDAFRRAVEEYWTGHVEESGRPVAFRTEVAVRVLGESEPFSRKAIKLLDGGTASGANAWEVSLGRDFEFGVAAHEFAHVLGLPDEYYNDYEPEDFRTINSADVSSLMANTQQGVVQPRHLKEIVRLFELRRKREAAAKAR